MQHQLNYKLHIASKDFILQCKKHIILLDQQFFLFSFSFQNKQPKTPTHKIHKITFTFTLHQSNFSNKNKRHPLKAAVTNEA